ncbi:UNVERIFIED_CONTAM: Aquaporin SIP1-1 [Sesamum calycinum]|uniref:Aquaporin SIP1-1 n=1 Tax=Sesamum calycinum TaxID=2727403 RepID=A0AAW2RP66_9LAMI
MKLLCNAEFEELSPRDLMLTSALNTDYLLTLPIYVDWKKASESNAIIFRRGYATERQKGLLIAEKLDYLQSKLLQNFFALIAKPLGKFGVWLNEVFKSITQKQDTEVLDYKLMLWLKELSLSLKPQSYDQVSDNLKGVDILSSDRPIWEAAQKAVTRYEGILSEVGPRERLLRKFLAWIGVVPSAPEQAFDFNLDCTGPESNLSPSFLSRISLGDIWKPASPKSCGNDFRKMLSTAISILFSQSILQEPSFQELILFYAEEIEERESTGQIEVPTVQMKIYERIPIPDLPVVFPHKKLSFRILDTVRLDVATILGLLAYFFSYKFEDILSSPSAILLDAIAASALVIYVTRVLLGYKQTRDRYQLLVNRTLHEKTVASGFGSIHFLLDASEQQQYKEAILVYATLLKAENDQVTSTRTIGDKCETFIYNVFEEKVEMPVDKAIDTLMRLGLVIKKVSKNLMAMKAAIKAAIADGLLTFMWIFCASSLGAVTYVASSALGLPHGLPTLLITTIFVFLLLFIFGFIGDLLGGATFNPTAIAAFYAAGAGGADSLVSAALRFPAQAAGAVGGALAILEVMPMQYKHMLGGPSLKVDLHTGAIAEGVLTFIITFAVLLIVLRGPSNPLVKNWLLAMSTVTLVVAGSSYTGPSMNPANVSKTSSVVYTSAFLKVY